MKKIFVLFCLSLSAIIYFTMSGGQAVRVNEPVKIYFVDRKLHRLVPTNYNQVSNNPKKIAREIVSELISGRDNNSEILRLIPESDKCITVKTDKSAAIVNLDSDITGYVSTNCENEKLLIYQIVNSLTSIQGINTVEFTIDGKKQRKFLGYLDMREIFTPDYDI